MLPIFCSIVHSHVTLVYRFLRCLLSLPVAVEVATPGSGMSELLLFLRRYATFRYQQGCEDGCLGAGHRLSVVCWVFWGWRFSFRASCASCSFGLRPGALVVEFGMHADEVSTQTPATGAPTPAPQSTVHSKSQQIVLGTCRLVCHQDPSKPATTEARLALADEKVSRF